MKPIQAHTTEKASDFNEDLFNVRIRFRERFEFAEFRFGVTLAYLEEVIVIPYRNGETVMLDGRIINPGEIRQVNIKAINRPPLNPSFIQRLLERIWFSRPDIAFEGAGLDVTEHFITGPPGTRTSGPSDESNRQLPTADTRDTSVGQEPGSDEVPIQNLDTDGWYLSAELSIPDLGKLPVDSNVSAIIKDRLEEAQLCLSAGAHLSAIFLCGSVLEAVLLGAAKLQPEEFNRSEASPKQDGKVKHFRDWHLSDLINVAHDVGLLKADVQEFSHRLRDYRNYIHPHLQMESGFTPDKGTAVICFQVLKLALASVAGER